MKKIDWILNLIGIIGGIGLMGWAALIGSQWPLILGVLCLLLGFLHAAASSRTKER